MEAWTAFFAAVQSYHTHAACYSWEEYIFLCVRDSLTLKKQEYHRLEHLESPLSMNQTVGEHAKLGDCFADTKQESMEWRMCFSELIDHLDRVEKPVLRGLLDGKTNREIALHAQLTTQAVYAGKRRLQEKARQFLIIR